MPWLANFERITWDFISMEMLYFYNRHPNTFYGSLCHQVLIMVLALLAPPLKVCERSNFTTTTSL
jgi:hypothetical protein